MDDNSSCEFEVNMTNLVERPYCSTSEWVLVLQSIFLAATVVGSLAGNSFILLLIARHRSLRYRSINVCLSAVITDLLLVVVFHLPALISVAAKRWVFGDIGCTITGFIAFYLIYVRWMSMAVIALDRFFYIIYSLTYDNWSKPFLIALTINAWIMPFILHIPSIFGYGTFSFRPGFSQCTIDCGHDLKCYEMFVAGFSIQFLVGAILPTSLYLAMYAISWTKRRKRIIMGTSLQPVNENGSNTNILSGQSLDQPLQSHGFNFWSKREIHALVTFLLVFVALLATNIPVYALTIMRRGFAVQYQRVPIWVHFIIIDLFYLSNLLDPLLIMRNRDFRKVIVQMFQKLISSFRSNNKMRRPSVVKQETKQ